MINMNEVIKKLMVQAILDSMTIDKCNDQVLLEVKDFDHSGVSVDELAELMHQNFKRTIKKIHVVVNGKRVRSFSCSFEMPRMRNTRGPFSFEQNAKVTRDIFNQPDPHQALVDGSRSAPTNWTSISGDPRLWSHPSIIYDYADQIQWGKALKKLPGPLDPELFFYLFNVRKFRDGVETAKCEAMIAELLIQHIEDPRLEGSPPNQWDGFRWCGWSMSKRLPELLYASLNAKKDEVCPHFWRFPSHFVAGYNNDEMKIVLGHWIFEQQINIDRVNPDWRQYVI